MISSSHSSQPALQPRARRWARWLGLPPVFQNNASGNGPPDMEELWRDFSRKLGGLLGGQQKPKGRDPHGQPPHLRNAGVGIGLISGVVGLIWLGSGFFNVQEGEQAVVTAFGKFDHLVNAGLSWRFPAPFQDHEIVSLTGLRSVDVGRSVISPASGLPESSMLTQDENIVDIRFSVQYRLKDARAYLYENANPAQAVEQAAESAVREIVGRKTMDSVLYKERTEIGTDLHKSVQAQLDRLNAGILIVNVNVGSVLAPEKVQAAFDDAFRANADRERFKNDGEAHAKDVIPKAQGGAARLREDAEGYRARVISTAEGDTQRFTQVLAEYQKAPSVTRDRMYIDAMRTMYSKVTKVMVDSKSNSNLLYLPLDKLIEQTTKAPALANTLPVDTSSSVPSSSPSTPSGLDGRTRDSQRTRDRDPR